jgi:glycosyltransferase involved in cell wall biosynthesis
MAFFMPLRIIYIHKTNLSAPDTSLTFVVNNALSLAALGIEVHLVIANRSRQNSKSLLRHRFNLNKLPDTFYLHAINPVFRTHVLFYLRAMFFVRRQQNPCIVITRTHRLLPYLLRKKQGHRYFFETHNFYYDLSLRTDLSKSAKNLSKIEQRFFNQLDGLLCLNNSQVDLYRKQGIKVPVHVFSSGLDRIEYSEERMNRIVYVGSMERINVKALCQLVKILPKNMEFVYIGGKSKTEIQFLAGYFDNEEFPENFRITGWIDKAALKSELGKAKIALLPLKDTFFNRYLTDPLKLFDYFSFGIPVIANKFPSIQSYVEDGIEGYFVDWQKPEEVSELISGILKNEELWNWMSSKVYEKAKGLTWNKRAEQQAKYFESLI